MILLSNDPRVIGNPETPPPVICEFCGAERYTEGINLLGRVIWFPGGAKACSCPKGKAHHNKLEKEREAQKEAERKEEENRKMRERVNKVINESGMGERFLQRTFENFTADTKERKLILAAAKTYAGKFEEMLPKRGKPLPGRNGFFIAGTKGTGKTHIAASIANYLLQRGISVICMTERDLFGRIKKTYSNSDGIDESAVRRLYETVPLLIIDDLGKEKPSEWTISTLYAIIDGRYERAMPIIITTNYDEKSLAMRLTPAGDDIKTAEAITDRLCEMCKNIIMTGESWRTK